MYLCLLYLGGCVFGQEQKRREDKHVREHHIMEQFRALSILKWPMPLLREELFPHEPNISSIPYGFSRELRLQPLRVRNFCECGCTGHSKENPTHLTSKVTIINMITCRKMIQKGKNMLISIRQRFTEKKGKTMQPLIISAWHTRCDG